MTHYFTKSNNAWSYSCAVVDASYLLDMTVNAFYQQMTLDIQAIQTALVGAQGETATVSGRNATKYTITYKDDSNQDQTSVVYIDNEYHVCTKMESLEGSYEVTSIVSPTSSPFANVAVPQDFDVYASYQDIYSGRPINGIALKAPNKFYVQFESYQLNGDQKQQVSTTSFIKVGDSSLAYGSNGGRIQVEEYDKKTEGSGYVSRSGVVQQGVAQWQDPVDKTADQFNGNVENVLAVSNYLDYAKSQYAVPAQDKTIAGVACKAYQASADMYGMFTYNYTFWLDPTTNIVFYGCTEMVMNGSTMNKNVNIDIKEYSTNVNSLFDKACDSLVYREGDGNPKDTDTHHQMTQPGVLKEATCVAQGERGTKCIYCGLKNVTESINIDPNNHTRVSDYWNDDGEGHHYQICNDCGENVNVGNHECDESKKQPTCSGYCEVECSICHRRVEFVVTESSEHTFDITNNFDLSPNYLNDAQTPVVVSFHCHCWYLGDGEHTPADDVTWTMPALSNADYFTATQNWATSYSMKKDALGASVKEVFPNESDENIAAFLSSLETALNFYNGSITIYNW